MSDPIDRAYVGARELLTAYLAASPARRGEIVAKLRPRVEDHAVVFEPDFAADSAVHGYRQLWGNAPVWPVPPDPVLEVYCATSEALAIGGKRVEAFPGGYTEIACYLKKGVVWVTWSLTTHGRASGHLFDGLVEVEPGRWGWFPRPWKVLPKPPQPTLWWD